MNRKKFNCAGHPATIRVLLAAMFLASGCAAQTAQKNEPASRSAGQPAFDQKESPGPRIPKFPVDTVIYFEAKHRTITMAKASDLAGDLADDPYFQTLRAENRFEDIAMKFVSHYRKKFKIDAPTEELRAKSVETDKLGLTHIRFQQVFSNIPVSDCEITVHLNRENSVYLVQGRYIPTPVDVPTRPVLDREDAIRAVAHNLITKANGCPECAAELVIYANPSGDPRLAWQVRSDSGLAEKWTHVIDAQTGDILKKESRIRTLK